jgi:hypothetical protein
MPTQESYHIDPTAMHAQRATSYTEFEGIAPGFHGKSRGKAMIVEMKSVCRKKGASERFHPAPSSLGRTQLSFGRQKSLRLKGSRMFLVVNVDKACIYITMPKVASDHFEFGARVGEALGETVAEPVSRCTFEAVGFKWVVRTPIKECVPENVFDQSVRRRSVCDRG